VNAQTPGPWRVEQDTTLIWGACNEDDTTFNGMGYPIAECRTMPISNWAAGPDYDAAEANARLIAAAPELKDAAVKARAALAIAVIAHSGGEFGWSNVGEHPVIAQLDAAIAKAGAAS
jgi:hypothetical protein